MMIDPYKVISLQGSNCSILWSHNSSDYYLYDSYFIVKTRPKKENITIDQAAMLSQGFFFWGGGASEVKFCLMYQVSQKSIGS